MILEVFLPNGDTLMRNEYPVCDYIKKDTLIWPLLEKSSDLPKNKPCPFPKGNYTIDNFEIDDSKFGPLPSGRYLGRVKIVGDGKMLMQVDVYASLNNFS